MSAVLKAAVLSAGLLFAAAGVASAQSCNEDIGALQQKRQAHIDALNKMSKAGNGKLDPIAACPRLRNLAAIEREMAAYMEKNQNWCSIPEQIVEQVKDGSGKTGQMAGQACKVAAEMRKMQQQQAAGGPVGGPAPMQLPRGPL
jgi:hypothetical protein